eukprot:scaffold2141_cov282-Pinguiococcus_pyrenoidosus.AAC.37
MKLARDRRCPRDTDSCRVPRRGERLASQLLELVGGARFERQPRAVAHARLSSEVHQLSRSPCFWSWGRDDVSGRGRGCGVRRGARAGPISSRRQHRSHHEASFAKERQDRQGDQRGGARVRLRVH